MALAESLGKEVSEYIKNLLNKDVTIIDDARKTVIAQDQESIGKLIKLPDLIEELSAPKNVSLNDKDQVLIPLRYESKNIAYLLLEDSPEINNFSNLIKSFAELLIQQHYENNRPVLDSTDTFISQICENYNSSNSASFESEAKILGYDVTAKRVGIVVHLKGFWDNCLLDYDQPSFERNEIISNWKRNLESSLNSFFTKNADVITAYLGNDRFAIFKAIENGEEENTKKLLKKSYKSIFEPLKNHRVKSITIGFSNAYSGVAGLVSARREAELTLELGERIWGENQGYFFGDLGLLSILADGDRSKKIDFANQILSKLRSTELSKTLENFFEHNLNLTETAEAMGIHRNTVIYRLNQITKILSADPRIFEQAMSIKIALIIRSLLG